MLLEALGLHLPSWIIDGEEKRELISEDDGEGGTIEKTRKYMAPGRLRVKRW
jgi:hypothetical protein